MCYSHTISHTGVHYEGIAAASGTVPVTLLMRYGCVCVRLCYFGCCTCRRYLKLEEPKKK